eukprot:6213350-Pleurochrysis_carterae.AAC.1
MDQLTSAAENSCAPQRRECAWHMRSPSKLIRESRESLTGSYAQPLPHCRRPRPYRLRRMFCPGI